MPKILDALNWCIKIANDSRHGYDQKNRQGPDYDCSSLIANALNKSGFGVKKDSYTGNLYSRLKDAGFMEISINAIRKPGDIFLTPGHHVVMCVDKNRIVHASINEKGKATGGKTGDQTGKEICVRNFYIPSYGWKYHLRYKTEFDTSKTVVEYALPELLKEVANGKYGTGEERKKNIEEMGLDYKTVQYFVNAMLNGGKYA